MKSMRKKRYQWSSYALTAILALCIWSCSKSSSSLDKDKGSPKPDPKSQQVDVYVAFSAVSIGAVIKYDAKIYKNDQQLYSYGDANLSTMISAMEVADGKVYAVGGKIEFKNGNNSFGGVLWEGQTEQYFGLNNTMVSSLKKTGKDTYLMIMDVAYQSTNIWKNEVKLHTIYGYYGSNMVVSGDDIYSCGEANGKAVIFKNESLLYTLSTGTCYVNAIWVEGNTVYAVGRERVGTKFMARVWKNGDLFYDYGEGEVCDICVSQNILYTTGYLYKVDNQVAKVWKNDKELYSLSNGNANAEGFAIGVVGKDIYVGGADNRTCKIWLNGALKYVMGSQVNDSKAYFSMRLVPKS